ncbi:hypothetical protein Nepgr_010219 [Nepenthes gracilis]|uniref:Uncharacterized protein n=1 Tax=Nepenthes gracilis TaxID=150966 RepID=A0AAD3SCH3_NEPGR|nr:hypothetical protein Nepgr_010219 [Nepenthes gracilis]
MAYYGGLMSSSPLNGSPRSGHSTAEYNPSRSPSEATASSQLIRMLHTQVVVTGIACFEAITSTTISCSLVNNQNYSNTACLKGNTSLFRPHDYGGLIHEFSISEDRPYHKSCYSVYFHPKCDVRNVYIPQNAAGLMEYRAHSLWKQNYYPSQESDWISRCCSCEFVGNNGFEIVAEKMPDWTKENSEFLIKQIRSNDPSLVACHIGRIHGHDLLLISIPIFLYLAG